MFSKFFCANSSTSRCILSVFVGIGEPLVLLLCHLPPVIRNHSYPYSSRCNVSSSLAGFEIFISVYMHLGYYIFCSFLYVPFPWGLLCFLVCDFTVFIKLGNFLAIYSSDTVFFCCCCFCFCFFVSFFTFTLLSSRNSSHIYIRMLIIVLQFISVLFSTPTTTKSQILMFSSAVCNLLLTPAMYFLYLEVQFTSFKNMNSLWNLCYSGIARWKISGFLMKL